MKPTIVLLDFRKTPKLYMEPDGKRFEVKSMKNTIDFKTGELLEAEQVQNLIKKLWTVRIENPSSKDYE